MMIQREVYVIGIKPSHLIRILTMIRIMDLGMRLGNEEQVPEVWHLLKMRRHNDAQFRMHDDKLGR